MKKLIVTFIFIIITYSSVYADDTYDRVIKNNMIRCGYTLYSVGLNKDLNTGKLWGIYKEIIEEIGRKLSLDIEWTEEVGWGQQIEGLSTGRYDMICSPASITATRTRVADYSKPLYYSPVWIWVRGDDTRFDNQPRNILNNPEIKIATIDGEQTDSMADDYFPKAEKVSLPQSSDFSSLMLNVITEKADLTFAEPLSVFEFTENNPNTLKRIDGDTPLTLVPNIFLIPRGQEKFKAMINNSLTELFLNGFIDRAIDQYEKYPDSYIRSHGYY